MRCINLMTYASTSNQIQTQLLHHQGTHAFTPRANQHRNDITSKEGEKVLLSTYNSRVQAVDATNKFLPKYIGPFTITKVISEVVYQLDLPETMKCHNVFHMDRLQSYSENHENDFPGRMQANRPLPPVEAPALELIVDCIIDRCWRELGKEGTIGHKAWHEWLVRW